MTGIWAPFCLAFLNSQVTFLTTIFATPRTRSSCSHSTALEGDLVLVTFFLPTCTYPPTYCAIAYAHAPAWDQRMAAGGENEGGQTGGPTRTLFKQTRASSVCYCSRWHDQLLCVPWIGNPELDSPLQQASATGQACTEGHTGPHTFCLNPHCLFVN